MRINLLDRIFGNCNKGIHKYREFLIKSKPPANFTKVRGNSGDVLDLIDSMTEKTYEIRCKHCGKTLEENQNAI